MTSRTFVCHAAPGHPVELCGDFPSWSRPFAMQETSPGRYEETLSLEPGIYRYKMRIDGHRWVLDPAADAVDHADGFENGLAVVGGSSPPLLFAPDRRHLLRGRDGRIVVHAEHLGGSTPAPATVRVSATLREGDPVGLEAPLVEVGRRGALVQLRATLKLPESHVGAGGELSFGAREAERFALPDAPGLLDEAPSRLRGAVLYAIFVDRFRRSPSSPPEPRAASRAAPSTAATFYGGDLDGIRESLGVIADLGATAIVLTPVHTSGSPHRYDAVDLQAIDPRIGGPEAFARLTSEAARRGLRVVVDAAFTHVNEAHPAFRDLLLRQERSPFAGWFRVRRFPVIARDTRTYQAYFGHAHLPMLDLANEDARAHVIAAARRLVSLGAGGLRLDAMEEAPDDLWVELRRACRAMAPELLFLGEIVGDRPSRYAGRRGVDTATDFGSRHLLVAFFARRAVDARQFWDDSAFSAHRTGPFDPAFRLLFLDNHDTARFRSICVKHDRLRLALVYLLTRPEPVWITCGTELGMAGGSTDARLEDVWPERMPMPDDDPSTRTRALLTALGRLRREHPALLSEATSLRQAEGGLLVVDRGGPEDPAIRVCLNADEGPARVDVPDGTETLLDTEGIGAVDRPLAGLAARVLRLPAGSTPRSRRPTMLGMAENIRQTPPNTIAISNLSDREKEVAAVKFDQGSKGYLTYDELCAWYQSERGGHLPTLRDLADFIGAPQHVVESEYLPGWKALQIQWAAATWKGDFHLTGFSDGSYRPAGNVRIGRWITADTEATPGSDMMEFVVNFDLIYRADFDQRLETATLVLGPSGFPKEDPSAPYGEGVELPMELYSQDGYIIYNRLGASGWSPEKKLLLAEVSTEDLRELAGKGGLSFFIRLTGNGGRAFYINRDGTMYQNFEITAAELAPQGQP